MPSSAGNICPRYCPTYKVGHTKQVAHVAGIAIGTGDNLKEYPNPFWLSNLKIYSRIEQFDTGKLVQHVTQGIKYQKHMKQ